MKSQTLPVKRRPASKGIFRRLSAVTRSRKQRVAATATAAEMELDDGGSKSSRALIIIFLTHIVAIGLFFIHQHFLAGRPAETAESAKTGAAEVTAAVVVVPPQAAAASLDAAEKPYVVKAGDSYARIAAAEGVEEDSLRLLNKHVNISPGLILKIPAPRIEAVAPVVVTATRVPTPDHNRVLVEAVDVSGAPKAHLARPNETREVPAHAAATATAATGKSYVVQPGDSIWRIAHHSKVSQDALLRANGISDARKIKPGMKLIIPQKENSKS